MTNAQEPRTPTIAAQIEALSKSASELVWAQRNSTLEVQLCHEAWAALDAALKPVPAIVTALRQAEAVSEISDEMQRDAWSEFEDDYLTNGNDGWLPAKVVSACRKAFHTAWPKGRGEAFAAALASIPKPVARPSADAAMVEELRGPLRFVDEGHPLGLTCYDKDGRTVSLHPAIMGAVFQVLASRQPAGVEK